MPDPSSAAELLAPEGGVARLLPHYEVRPQQQQMAELVGRALRENKLAVIEAGPGTGKSFGYLFALLLHALRTGTVAVVSSSTHVLQDQLIQRDIPFMQRVLEEHGIEFRAAEVKGMGAYLCRLALAETSGALIVDFPDAVGKLERWAEQAREGTRSEAPAVPPEVWEQVRAERDTCTRDRCRFYDSCFFFNARRRAAQAHLLVANHSLVFADLAIKEEGGRVLPHYTVLVLDEAHNVEDAATRFLGLEISLPGLKMLLHRLYDGRGRGALPGLEQAVPDFRRLPAGERRALPDFLQRQVYPEVGNAEAALENAFRGIERAYHELAPNPEHAREMILKPLRLTPGIYEHDALVHAQAATHHMAATLELVANRVGQFLRRVEPAEDLLNSRDFVTARSACRSLRERALDIKDFFEPTSGVGEVVKWIQPDTTQRDTTQRDTTQRDTTQRYTTKKGAFRFKLASAPLDLAPHLEQRLFKKLDACLLTSATLAAGRQFEYIRGRLGLAGELAPRTETLLLDSPFDYQRNVLVGIPDDLPEPTDRAQDFLQEAARFIWRALKVSRGRSLVLFHAWFTLRATHRLIAPHAEKLGFRVLCQGELSRNRLIEIFRRDLNSVLLATTSYREGIDVPGEALSNLILHRLPFPVPDEPVTEARMERIEADGRSSFREYELPAAVIAFKQAFGRLIRRRTDYGIFLCLDKRLLTRRYGGQFLQALPRCEIVGAPKEKVLRRAAEFLRQRDQSGSPSSGTL